MSSTLGSSQKKARVFYGWWVVAAAFLAMTVESGVNFYGFGVFLKSFVDELGWSRAESASAMSLYWLTQAFLSPFVGRLIGRFRCRKLMAAGAIVLGLAFFFLSRIDAVWQLYAGYILVGAGATGLTLVPVGTVIANWFSRRRGLVTGITFTGLGFGGAVVSPTLGYLNPHWGWRTSYLAIAAAMILIVLPVVSLVIRTRPEEKGLLPDGGEAPVSAAAQTGSYRRGDAAAIGDARLYATPIFWVLSLGFLMASLGTLAVATHLYAFLTDLAWPVETAVTALSLTGILSMGGKLFFGNLSDRISPCYTAIMCFALQGLGLALVMVLRLDPVLWLYVVMYGVGMGGIPAVRPLVVAEVFGVGNFASVFGMVTGISTLGAVLGPFFAGYVFDVTGKYDVAFMIFAITYTVAIAGLLVVKRRSRAEGLQLVREGVHDAS